MLDRNVRNLEAFMGGRSHFFTVGWIRRKKLAYNEEPHWFRNLTKLAVILISNA